MLSKMALAKPTFEQHPDGFGVFHSNPRISWNFADPNSGIRDWVQTAYDVEIKRDRKINSYHVSQEQSVLATWPSTPLKSRELAEVRIRASGKFTGRMNMIAMVRLYDHYGLRCRQLCCRRKIGRHV